MGLALKLFLYWEAMSKRCIWIKRCDKHLPFTYRHTGSFPPMNCKSSSSVYKGPNSSYWHHLPAGKGNSCGKGQRMMGAQRNRQSEHSIDELVHVSFYRLESAPDPSPAVCPLNTAVCRMNPWRDSTTPTQLPHGVIYSQSCWKWRHRYDGVFLGKRDTV